MRWCLVTLLIAFGSVKANDIPTLFPVGSGSKFDLELADGIGAELTITIAASSKDTVAVEYYFTSRQLVRAMDLWQQYVLRLPDNGPPELTAGYIFSQMLTAPQKLPLGFLTNLGGIQLSDFLIARNADLDALKIGEEHVILPAGRTKATHYRKRSQGQTLDFWISDDAKPIGLVRMASVDATRAEQNYTITLSSLLKNVRPTIDPTKAIPFDDRGKAFFDNDLIKELMK